MRLQTRAGLWSAPVEVRPLGVKLRPTPSLWPVGLVSWRVSGQQNTVHLRWRYPGAGLEAALLAKAAVDVAGELVPPEPTASFDVEVADNADFTSAVVLNVEAEGLGGSGMSLGAESGWAVFEAELTVPTSLPVFARVRARNVDGFGPWSMEGGGVDGMLEVEGEGRPLACAEGEFQAEATEDEPARCKVCPPEAVCAGLGRNNITARSGYWRVEWDETRTAYARCLRPRACAGWSAAVLTGSFITPPSALSLVQPPDCSLPRNIP